MFRLWASLGAAAASGAAVELAAGRREAWDTSAYWSLGLPAMVLAALLCGAAARERPVWIGYAPFLGQLVAMVAKTGAGSMLPLGVVLMAVIGTAGAAAAWAGALAGRKVLGLPERGPS